MYSEKELIQMLELLAHKVKNPTHSIGLHLEILKSKLSKNKKDADDYLKPVETISKELQRLNLIIKNFVDYMIPAGQSRKQFKLKSLLAIVRAEVEPYAQSSAVKLEFEPIDDDPKLQANVEELRTALVHLIDNAIEASGKNGIISIKTRTDKKTGIEIEIHDNGNGIPQGEAKKILSLFYTTKKEHVGLGLPLAKKLIEENGGKLRMRTAENKGTQVIVTFAS